MSRTSKQEMTAPCSVGTASAIATTTGQLPLRRSALLALFACVSVTGCGGGDAPVSTTPPPPVAAPAPAPKPAPVISSFTPDTGPSGTLVTLSGINLSGTTAVLFNGTAAPFSQVSATQLTATLGADATTGPVTVTTPGGTATSAARFTVTVPVKKLKVFILAGQSNMLGYGKVDLGGNPATASREPNIIGGLGSLRAMVDNNPDTYGYLVDASKPITYPLYTGTKTYPSWKTRNDVWVSHWTEAAPRPGSPTVESRNGGLTVGFGAQNLMPEGYIGPEYGFGQVVGNALAEPVLLIKTSWGGRSLAVDFRPPSSGGTTGPKYTEMVAIVRQVLSNLKTHYPAYDGAGYEIAGFGWHQGWNDRVNRDHVAQYEANMVNLIKDLRRDFGVPAMPVVIGNTGMAVEPTDTQAVALITAQGNVANPAKYPQFAGTVTTVDTRPFYFGNNSPAPTFGFHWNYNAESYFRIGESMGTAMVKLLKP